MINSIGHFDGAGDFPGCTVNSTKPTGGELPELPLTLRHFSLPVRTLPVPTTASLFHLTDGQKKHFTKYFRDPRRTDVKPHKRLQHYLESVFQGFDNKGKTATAAQTLSDNKGNCLSLAMVTKALADVASLHIEFQQVDSKPQPHPRGGQDEVSGHVRSHVFDPTYCPLKGRVTLVQPRVAIDYFPHRRDIYGEMLSEQDFVALCYQSMASEALCHCNLPLAYSMIIKALCMAPKSSPAFYLLALLANRVGYTEKAEAICQFALAQDNGFLPLLESLVDLLKCQRRFGEAMEWQEKAKEFCDQNPFRWVEMATSATVEGNYRHAGCYLQRAGDLAPYLEDVDFGMAKLHFAQGHHQAANECLKMAQAKAHADH